MKKILFTAVILCASMTVNAQVKFGLRGGVNLTNMSFSNLASNISTENTTGFYVGPTLKIKIPVVGLGLDGSVIYNQKGCKINGESVTEKEIAIPINLRYEFGLGDVANIFLKAGPQFAFPVGTKDFDITASNENGRYSLKSSNFSINLGFGATLASHLELSANYNIACGKTGEGFWNNTKQAFGDGKSNSWQLGLAYYF